MCELRSGNSGDHAGCTKKSNGVSELNCVAVQTRTWLDTQEEPARKQTKISWRDNDPEGP